MVLPGETTLVPFLASPLPPLLVPATSSKKLRPVEAIASRLEAIALRLEAITTIVTIKLSTSEVVWGRFALKWRRGEFSDPKKTVCKWQGPPNPVDIHWMKGLPLKKPPTFWWNRNVLPL